MEDQLLADIREAFTVSPGLGTLCSARSLVLNSSTSSSTVSELLGIIAHFIRTHGDRHFHLLPHTLVLLSAIADRHTELSSHVFNIVRGISLLNGKSARLGAQSLNILASIGDRNENLARELNEIGECIFLSLCFRPSVSVRPWLLWNAERFRVRPSVLVTVFLGFTRDPLPCVRIAALSGLSGLGNIVDFEGRDLVEGCYRDAIGSLNDTEDRVRLAAMKTVTVWGLRFIESQTEACKIDCCDVLFLQLASMVRDMSVAVRIATFEAITQLGSVSEDLLLQAMSKRALKTTKDRKFLDQNFIRGLEKLMPAICGGFVHGLEDEYYEVRRSACSSLQSLTSLSAKFSEEALRLLVDVLNDDTVIVRLQALTTLQHMAIRNPLKVQQIHLHMLIGTLIDNSAPVRSVARIIMKSLELQRFNMFKSCIDGLLENLKEFPQDEAEVFNVLFAIGCGHGKFAVSMVGDVLSEIEPPGEGRTYPDSTRIAALLVLAISAPFSQQPDCTLPPTIFSYAVLFLGRISRALHGTMGQNALLAYLSHNSRSIPSPIEEFGCYEDIHNSCSRQAPASQGEMLNSVNSILENINYLWTYLQLGHFASSIRTLEVLEEQLATIAGSSHEYDITRAFAVQYIQAIKLLAKVSQYFLSPNDFMIHSTGNADLMLEKLDRTVTKMLHVFIDLAEDEELHILEFIILACLFRLCGAETRRESTIPEKLFSAVSRVNTLHEELSIQPSQFFEEVKACLSDNSFSVSPLILKQLLPHFSLKQFVLRENLRQLNAKLNVCGNDVAKPLAFVPGIPVGIPLGITLYNVSVGSKLWLRMSVNQVSLQFIYLDIQQYEECDGIRKFTFVAPFYSTPNCNFFKIGISVCVECIFQGTRLVGGPQCEVTHLCDEMEVQFCTR